MAVWNEVLTGIVLVAGGYWIIKMGYQYNQFRRSVYKEIYSGYFEYAFRKKNLIRLSESYYLNNELGKHRIFYQIAQPKNEKIPQAYVLIILSTGIYILNIKNQSDKIILKQHGDMKQIYMEKDKKSNEKMHEYIFKNPMDESRFFAKRMAQRIGDASVRLKSMVVFPEKAELVLDGIKNQEIQIAKRNEVIELIKKDMEVCPKIFSNQRIDELYHQIADESIEMERYM